MFNSNAIAHAATANYRNGNRLANFPYKGVGTVVRVHTKSNNPYVTVDVNCAKEYGRYYLQTGDQDLVVGSTLHFSGTRPLFTVVRVLLNRVRVHRPKTSTWVKKTIRPKSKLIGRCEKPSGSTGKHPSTYNPYRKGGKKQDKIAFYVTGILPDNAGITGYPEGCTHGGSVAVIYTETIVRWFKHINNPNIDCARMFKPNVHIVNGWVHRVMQKPKGWRINVNFGGFAKRVQTTKPVALVPATMFKDDFPELA